MIISGSNPGRIDNTIQKLQTSYPDSASNVSGTALDLTKTAELESGLRTLFDKVTASGTTPINHIVFTARDPVRGPPGGPALSELDPTTVHRSNSVRLTAPLVIAKVAPEYMVKDHLGHASMTVTTGTMAYKPAKGWSKSCHHTGLFVLPISGSGSWKCCIRSKGLADGSETGVGAIGGLGVDGLVRGLAVEMAPQIRVNAVAPGAIRTPLLQGALDKLGQAYFSEGTLTKSIGEPEDIAEAYLYLMKDRFITGQVILSDGGRLLA